MKALTFHTTQFDIIDRNGQPWLRGYQIGTALGYTNQPDAAIRKIFDRNADEFTSSMTALVELDTPGGKQQVRIFSLRGVHLLAMLSRTKVAKEFRHWVLDVLEGVAEAPAKPKRHPKALPNGLTLDQQASIKALVARPPLHYPASLWLELNPHLRSALGDNRLSLGLRSLCGMDNRSPALALLGELSRAGHDVEACRLEVLAMRHHLERYWDLCRLLQTSGDNGLNAAVTVTLR